MEPVEPDLSLLETRSHLVPILLVVALVVGSILALVLSPPRKPRKLPRERPPAPASTTPAARAPLLVTLEPSQAEPAQGWCCAGGKVTAGTRAACDTGQGAFFAAEKDARERCATGTAGSPKGRGTGI